jgi:hypothetical protein
MVSEMPRLPDDVRGFLRTYWDTDVRLTSRSASARSDMKLLRIEGDVRRFLLEVIQRGAASPEAWSKLFNFQTFTAEEVREDATMWLYDDTPLPREGGGSGAITPPQV